MDLLESWSYSAVHLLWTDIDGQLLKKISQATISMYLCDLTQIVSLLPCVSHLHVSRLCTVLGPPFWAGSLVISPELSWGQFIPPVEVLQYPSFPGSIWSMVWAAWATLVGAAHPLLHWCKSCGALLCPIRSDFVCMCADKMPANMLSLLNQLIMLAACSRGGQSLAGRAPGTSGKD